MPFPGSLGHGGGTRNGISFRPSKTNLFAAVKAIFHPSTNPGVSTDDPNNELDVNAGESYSLPAATESVRGGVRGATSTQASATSGTTVLGWSVTRLRAAIAAAVKSASTTVTGIVRLARNEDVDASETDTSRVLTVASAKRLIARLISGKVDDTDYEVDVWTLYIADTRLSEFDALGAGSDVQFVGLTGGSTANAKVLFARRSGNACIVAVNAREDWNAVRGTGNWTVGVPNETPLGVFHGSAQPTAGDVDTAGDWHFVHYADGLGIFTEMERIDAKTGTGSAFRPTKAALYQAVKSIFHPSTNAGVSADDANHELDVPGGAPALTDAQIGDKAFSTPPSDLTDDEEAAVRTAVGLGTAATADTGTSSGDVPVLDSGGTLADRVIPGAIARDTEVTAAVEALKGGAPASMDTLKELADAIGLRFRDRGDFGSTTSDYVARDVVRHTAPAAAFYIARGNVPAGKTPGVASDWTTYWYRLGWENGAPSSLVGGPTVANRVMEFTERGGTTHEVAFPEGLGVSSASRAERISFQAIPTGQSDPEGQPLASNARSVVFGDPGELIITGVSGNDFTVAAGLYLVKVEAEATPAANNATLSWELRQASDDSFLAQTTSPNMTGGNVARPVSAVAALFLAADATINVQVHRAVQNSALAAGWSVTFMRWGGSEAGLSYYNAYNDATSDPKITLPVLTAADKTVAADETLEFRLLAATGPSGINLQDPIFTDYGGSIRFQVAGQIGLMRLVVGLGYRLFPGTAKQVTFWSYRSISIPWWRAGDTLTFGVPLSVFQTRGRLAPGQYPQESDDLTSTLVTLAQTDFNSPIGFQLLVRARGFLTPSAGSEARAEIVISDVELDSPSLTVYQIGSEPSGAPSPTPHPHVSGFGLTSGNLSPAAGSIGTLVYGFNYEVSQSSHASAMRVVGFKGTEANPDTVSVLATIAEADFHKGTGSVVIPGGVSLAANESYTVRLEVYETGQTPATDQPVSYKDARITAHAPATANYHVGYVAYDSDDSGVADTLARITDFSNDTATAQSIPSTMAIQLPTSGEYQMYLAAKASETQPTGFTLSGLNATNAFYAAQDKTLDSVAYKFYILKPINRLTSANNGQAYGVTT
ncbi:MAG: hypothetical protein OXG79_12490 [Chloroflexi bacterium]|nr:hypothetical protein [Chloroflexota bacterium]